MTGEGRELARFIVCADRAKGKHGQENWSRIEAVL